MKSNTSGVLFALSSFIFWGIMPAFWKQLGSVPSAELLAHRIIWTCVIAAVYLLLTKREVSIVKAIGSWKNLVLLIISGVLLAGNWFIFVWAVNSGHVLDGSLGYYINPLVSIFIGMLFFKEKLNRYQIIALLLACTGVVILIFRFGKLPWIALTLAFSFAAYGMIKKIHGLDSILALGTETLVALPPALIFIFLIQPAGETAIINGAPLIKFLLVMCGPVTVVPLILFAKGVTRINLSQVGFLQFIAPSLMLLLGVVLYGEHFTGTHAVSFGFIWAALLLSSLSRTKVFSKKNGG
jgi:chloramphenicol-sensitive protein RarD